MRLNCLLEIESLQNHGSVKSADLIYDSPLIGPVWLAYSFENADIKKFKWVLECLPDLGLENIEEGK